VLPMLNAVLLIIPNASVLLFPGWFQPGRDGPQGIEATGQRLIFLVGQLLVFVIALIPAGLAAVGAFFALSHLGYGSVGAPIAAILCGIVLAVEDAIAVIALGRIFERFDLSAEL